MTRRARQLTVVLLCLLAAQFVVGMTANFYARIPPTLPGVRGNFDARLGSAARWALLHGPPEVKLHVPSHCSYCPRRTGRSGPCRGTRHRN